MAPEKAGLISIAIIRDLSIKLFPFYFFEVSNNADIQIHCFDHLSWLTTRARNGFYKSTRLFYLNQRERYPV